MGEILRPRAIGAPPFDDEFGRARRTKLVGHRIDQRRIVKRGIAATGAKRIGRFAPVVAVAVGAGVFLAWIPTKGAAHAASSWSASATGTAQYADMRGASGSTSVLTSVYIDCSHFWYAI